MHVLAFLVGVFLVGVSHGELCCTANKLSLQMTSLTATLTFGDSIPEFNDVRNF